MSPFSSTVSPSTLISTSMGILNSRPSGCSSYCLLVSISSNSGGRSSGFILLIEISVSSSRAPAGISNVSISSALVILPPSAPIIALTILLVSSSSHESTENKKIKIKNCKNKVSFFMVRFPHLYRIYDICIFCELEKIGRIELVEQLLDSLYKMETTFDVGWKYIAVVYAFTPFS